MREFLHDYDDKKGPRPLSPYATTTYDSMWAIALTLKGSLEYWQNGSDIGGQNDILQSFTYERGAEIRNIFFDVMQNLEFLGISVRLKKRTVFYSFPKRLILNSSKLKEFTDDNFKFDKNGEKFSKGAQNTVGKGEIALYEQFLLFPQCFQKPCTADT